MGKSALALLSGGLDSTVNLYWAVRELSVPVALTVDYGQRAFEQEKRAAARSCADLNIEHLIVDLKPVFAGAKSSLLDPSQDVPVGAEVNLESLEQSLKSAERVWVPNRNGVLLNVAACVAETRHVDFVIPGFNGEEAQTFPDNSFDFIEATNRTFSFSTSNHVQVKCYTHGMDKIEIYRMAREFEIPEANIWSCYRDGEWPCGECESCLRSERAREAYEVMNA